MMWYRHSDSNSSRRRADGGRSGLRTRIAHESTPLTLADRRSLEAMAAAMVSEDPALVVALQSGDLDAGKRAGRARRLVLALAIAVALTALGLVGLLLASLWSGVPSVLVVVTSSVAVLGGLTLGWRARRSRSRPARD